MPRMSQVTNLSAVKNVSPVKGAKVSKVPQNLSDNNRQRRKTLLDEPMLDKRFEALTASAFNQAKQSKKSSV